MTAEPCSHGDPSGHCIECSIEEIRDVTESRNAPQPTDSGVPIRFGEGLIAQRTYERHGRRMRCVAKLGGVGDWTAYEGPADWSPEKVARSGDKLRSPEEAVELFPFLVAERWRW